MQPSSPNADVAQRVPAAADIEGPNHNGFVAGDRLGLADQRREQIETLTVLVPTRNERGNIEPLLDRLSAVSGELHLKVLFVDDSDDGTPEVITRLSAVAACPVAVLHRPNRAAPDARPGRWPRPVGGTEQRPGAARQPG